MGDPLVCRITSHRLNIPSLFVSFLPAIVKLHTTRFCRYTFLLARRRNRSSSFVYRMCSEIRDQGSDLDGYIAV